jgi:hypothetical protein
MTEFGELFRIVQQAINWEESRAKQSNSESPSANNEGNLVKQLSTLADLFDRGLLTEKEFADTKARLLN